MTKMARTIKIEEYIDADEYGKDGDINTLYEYEHDGVNEKYHRKRQKQY